MNYSCSPGFSSPSSEEEYNCIIKLLFATSSRESITSSIEGLVINKLLKCKK
jgi:hypothetical protein